VVTPALGIGVMFPALLPGLRRTIRSLARQPGFTAAAVLTLAFGLGATTAIFAVVYGVLLKPLPYPDAHELVSLRHTAPGLSAAIGGAAEDLFGFAESMYVTYRDENRVFEHVGLWNDSQQTLTGLGETEQVSVLAVAQGTLQALGIQPVIGRWFSDAEYTLAPTDNPPPVIVSHAFWQRRLGGDTAALGRTLSLDFRTAQIVGIMPAGFRFLDVKPQPDVISAIRTDGAQIAMTNTTDFQRPLMLSAPNFSGLARLRDGVTLAEANADVERLLSIWLGAWSPGGRTREAVADWQFAPALTPLKDDVVGGVAGMLWIVMGAVGAVLAIACANIANLLLARADARRRELAIRAALGAGRRRIAGELLREAVVLGIGGGVLGIALAHAGLELLAAFAPPNLPRAEEITAGVPVLAFAAVTALVASLAFGAIPAVKHAFTGEPRLGPRSASASPERNRARSVLIVVQVALALVLLVAAGLMLRTFASLSAVEPGFRDPASIQATRIFIPFAAIQESERYTRVYRETLERIEALPGVTAAGFGNAVPLEDRGQRLAIAVEGRPEPAGEPVPIRRFLSASPGYFAALGTRLIAGRDLEWRDIDDQRNVALVSASLARELWGEPEAALGKRIRPVAPGSGNAWHEIVGVTQDVYQEGVHRPPPRTVYTPLVTEGTDLRGVIYAIRSDRAGTESFANEVRQAVWASHPDIVVTVSTMQEIYSAALARTSFVLALLAIAGTMALLLSVVGIYGVISYIVAQRKCEIGIRLALGARPQAVKRLIVLRSLAVAAVGVAVGLAAALGLARLLQSLLFEVRPLDPLTYIAALAVLLAAALPAAYLPARRAAALDPMETLRAE
jgi:putative ABC transport system permease protein